MDVPSWVAASIARLILRRVRSLVLFHRTWRLNCHLVWYCGFLRITDPVILAGRGDGRLVTFGSQPRLIGMDWKSLSVEEEREHNIHVRCSFFLFIPLSVFVGTEIRLFGIAIMACRSHDVPRCVRELLPYEVLVRKRKHILYLMHQHNLWISIVPHPTYMHLSLPTRSCHITC